MAKLTEQDIINWNGPEEEYMNEDQLAFFRELLVKQQDELIENASNTATELKSTKRLPTLPTAPHRKKNTRSNCAPATANANCWVKSKPPSA